MHLTRGTIALQGALNPFLVNLDFFNRDQYGQHHKSLNPSAYYRDAKTGTDQRQN